MAEHVAGRGRRFLNIKLDNIRVLDEDKHPHMVSARSPFQSDHPGWAAGQVGRWLTRAFDLLVRWLCGIASSVGRSSGTSSCPKPRSTHNSSRTHAGGVSNSHRHINRALKRLGVWNLADPVRADSLLPRAASRSSQRAPTRANGNQSRTQRLGSPFSSCNDSTKV